jgi:hypothetical protein
VEFGEADAREIAVWLGEIERSCIGGRGLDGAWAGGRGPDEVVTEKTPRPETFPSPETYFRKLTSRCLRPELPSGGKTVHCD